MLQTIEIHIFMFKLNHSEELFLGQKQFRIVI